MTFIRSDSLFNVLFSLFISLDDFFCLSLCPSKIIMFAEIILTLMMLEDLNHHALGFVT